MVQQSPNWSESRRKATATSVLDRIALFCLGASLLFWGVLYFSLIAPPLPQVTAQTLVALSLTVMSALIIVDPRICTVSTPEFGRIAV
jgi:xanthine/uracil/vitamin C permease (AzgA family)